MSLSHEIASHLPFLRRYARALAGSQASGDAYVRATLEAIVESPDRYHRVKSPVAWCSNPQPLTGLLGRKRQTFWTPQNLLYGGNSQWRQKDRVARN